jgi:hypothetical protein
MVDWNEKTVTAGFESAEGGKIIVFPYCPKCGKFLKHGHVLESSVGNVFLKFWICKQHGEVQPDWTRGE